MRTEKGGEKRERPANQATQRLGTIKDERGRGAMTTISSRIQWTKKGMGDNLAFDRET